MNSFYNLLKTQLYKTIVSVRFAVAVLLTLFFLLMELISIRAMASYFNQKINYSVISFALSNQFLLLILFLSCLLIFSTFPYRDEQQMQLILRTGKVKWLISYTATIFITSMLFISVIVLFSFLIINTHLDFSNEWGKILGTLGQQPHFRENFGIEYNYSYYIQINLTPLNGFIRSTILCFLVMTLVGNFVFIGNLISNKLGLIIGSSIIFIHILSAYVLEHYFYFISPISWISLFTTNIETSSALPNLNYIIRTLLMGYLLVLILLVYFSRKRNNLELF